RIRLERDEVTAGRKRPRQPNRAVAAERADLQNLARADCLREQHQKLALIWGNVDLWQARCFAPRQRGFFRGGILHQKLGDIFVHRAEIRLAHSTFPGFKIPLGSKADLILRISSSSSGRLACGRRSRFMRPIPCSALMVPPRSSTISYTAALRASQWLRKMARSMAGGWLTL